jgi:CPA1 family monovalent cation:H+ antiporter
MELSFEKFALLLLVSAVVAVLTRRLHMPYVVGLVAAGAIMALLPFSPQIPLTKELLFTVLLPPLIFEAALHLNWQRLRRDLLVVLVLATFGVIISGGVAAMGMHYLVNWQWPSALVFGALIAATDPVSVIATFKEAKVRGRLLLLIESESLFNDGTAAVLFASLLEYATGSAHGPLVTATNLFIIVCASLFIGAFVAGGVLVLAGRTNDHLVEITCTTVGAYGSFLLAEHLQVSGVLSALAAGLVLGNWEPLGTISERGREAVKVFWEYAAFVANSLVFLLVGMREGSQNFTTGWPAIGAAILLVLVGRAVAVYSCCGLYVSSALRVSAKHQHVLFWGGLRGALALALALALPAEVPQRNAIVTVSFAVVAFSVFVQGLTLKPLLRTFGEIPPPQPGHR